MSFLQEKGTNMSFFGLRDPIECYTLQTHLQKEKCFRHMDDYRNYSGDPREMRKIAKQAILQLLPRTYNVQTSTHKKH